jgi:hypothetical protein
LDLAVGQVRLLQQVGHPQGEAVHDHEGVGGRLPQRPLQLAGRLEGQPVAWPFAPVPPDALGHLLVAGLQGGDHRHRTRPAAGHPDRQGGLAAAGAAEQQHQRHQ